MKRRKSSFQKNICSHDGVISHARPVHVADGSAWQSFGGGEVAQREGQNHGQTPDTDDDPCGDLC